MSASIAAVLEAPTGADLKNLLKNDTDYDGWFYPVGQKGKPRNHITVKYSGSHGKHYVTHLGHLYTASLKRKTDGTPYFDVFEKDKVN